MDKSYLLLSEEDGKGRRIGKYIFYFFIFVAIFNTLFIENQNIFQNILSVIVVWFFAVFIPKYNVEHKVKKSKVKKEPNVITKKVKTKKENKKTEQENDIKMSYLFSIVMLTIMWFWWLSDYINTASKFFSWNINSFGKFIIFIVLFFVLAGFYQVFTAHRKANEKMAYSKK